MPFKVLATRPSALAIVFMRLQIRTKACLSQVVIAIAMNWFS